MPRRTRGRGLGRAAPDPLGQVHATLQLVDLAGSECVGERGEPRGPDCEHTGLPGVASPPVPSESHPSLLAPSQHQDPECQFRCHSAGSQQGGEPSPPKAFPAGAAGGHGGMSCNRVSSTQPCRGHSPHNASVLLF